MISELVNHVFGYVLSACVVSGFCAFIWSQGRPTCSTQPLGSTSPLNSVPLPLFQHKLLSFNYREILSGVVHRLRRPRLLCVISRRFSDELSKFSLIWNSLQKQPGEGGRCTGYEVQPIPATSGGQGDAHVRFRVPVVWRNGAVTSPFLRNAWNSPRPNRPFILKNTLSS